MKKAIMAMSRFALILLAVARFAVASPAPAAPGAVARPNIVLIVADDMGYADAGFMGATETRTPHLDALAKGGAVLRSHYVQPVCSPTRSVLMTGRHVYRTGVYSVVTPGAEWGLPLAERTLPQALREAGYETAISGKWHLGEFQPEYRPTARGFDHQYGLWFGMINYFTHLRDGVQDWHRDDQPCGDEGYATELIAREACRVIRDRNPAKPLFLYLPFNAVHGPLQVPDSYLKPFERLSGVRRTYAGMLAAMDEAVGQVVAALEAAKIRGNTLIVFTSDNGGPSPGKVTDNGPLRAGKGSIYEGGIRVCAFANAPGRIPAGQVIDEPVHGVDWYPTLIRQAGGSLDQKLPLDGRDVWSVLTEKAKSPHDMLVLHSTKPGRAAIRVGEWKLLLGASDRDAEEGAGQASGALGVELYNLSTDIGERHNLAAEQPGRVKELQARLSGALKNAVPPGSGAVPAPRKAKGKAKGKASASWRVVGFPVGVRA